MFVSQRNHVNGDERGLLVRRVHVNIGGSRCCVADV